MKTLITILTIIIFITGYALMISYSNNNMSRTNKNPYTKSKRFDKTCRCNGGCPYCRDNRLHKHNKQPKLKDFEEE